MNLRLPRVKSGQILRDTHINKTSEAVESSQIRIGPNSGIGFSESRTGTSYWVIPKQIEIWAKITGHGSSTGGNSGPYSWTEQIPQAGGTWSNGSRSGTLTVQQAYESTKNIAVPTNSIVRLFYAETSQQWNFTYRKCS